MAGGLQLFQQVVQLGHPLVKAVLIARLEAILLVGHLKAAGLAFVKGLANFAKGLASVGSFRLLGAALEGLFPASRRSRRLAWRPNGLTRP